MNIILDQPAGIGDIFFIQKISSVLAKENTIYHPVTQECWDNGVKNLISDARIMPIAEFDNSITNTAKVINLSNQPKPNGYIDTMTSKYQGLGIDWSDWVDYFKYSRIKNKELSLQKWYKIQNGDPYIVVNSNFASKPNMINSPAVFDSVDKDYDGKVLNINPSIPDTTVFDYCMIFENAEEIHTTDTCFLYIIESLELKAKKLVVHPRFYDRSEKTISHLFNKPWKWQQYESDLWNS